MREIERLFNLLDFDMGSYVYHRPTLDNKPYQMVKGDKKTTIVFNATGIKKEDITVDIIKERNVEYLTISGETKNEILNKTYSVSGRFSVDSNEIENIEWTTVDGVLEIVVLFKEPVKSSVNIKMK